MIYQVKDNKKIPLGTQFDNSWEIEYNRDLSSQIIDKSEWTATEDCWFQYHSIFYNKSTDTNQTAYTTLTIQLNGIVISNTDNIQDTSGGLLYEIVASVLMKKGDKIAYVNTDSTKAAPPFTVKCAKIFPIHRILSKEDEVETNLPVPVRAGYEILNGRIIYTVDLNEAFAKMKIGDIILVTLSSNTSLLNVMAIIPVLKTWSRAFQPFTPVYLSENMTYDGYTNSSIDHNIKFSSPGTNNGVVHCSYIKL